MQTIWKFTFEVEDRISIEAPKGAQILDVQTQYDCPCLWMLVDPLAAKEERHFRIYGTGNPIREFDERRYIGTFQQGAFVWHLFEVVA